jgi:hypothetical protein
MNSFISPFEDDSARPIDANPAPGGAPDNDASLLPPENAGDNDGAPPVLHQLRPHESSRLVQQLLKAILDSAVALHIMSAKDFDAEADRLLNDPQYLPLGIRVALANIAANAGTLPLKVPAWRCDYLKALKQVPVSVNVQHGFLVHYSTVMKGHLVYYEARVTRIGQSHQRHYLLRFRPEVMEALLRAFDEALAVALGAQDNESASACLRGIAEGRFPSEVMDLVKLTLLIPAIVCEGGFERRVEMLNSHPTTEALMRLFAKM